MAGRIMSLFERYGKKRGRTDQFAKMPSPLERLDELDRVEIAALGVGSIRLLIKYLCANEAS